MYPAEIAGLVADLDAKEPKAMYLDESGDHNLMVIDSQYPVFVLGGVIVARKYAEDELEEQIRHFKREQLGDETIILRTADINRARNGFEPLKDTALRERFYVALNELIRSLRFEVVACAVMKHDHLNCYGIGALDPYLLSLQILVERLCYVIGPTIDANGLIVAEKRGHPLDQQIELAWLNLKISGTDNVKGSTIEARIAELMLRDKQANLAGLQLADLVVNPIGRHVLGRTPHEDWRIIEEKLRRHPRTGDYLGAGLVVLPRKR